MNTKYFEVVRAIVITRLKKLHFNSIGVLPKFETMPHVIKKSDQIFIKKKNRILNILGWPIDLLYNINYLENF